ncbi:hypothetical protein [Burkholderia mayonis]|uniref:hypothetical protein n=1 Tax=Burkholderia mayonis TaxID=1385591 RepID=UPI000A9808B2|nr:hypothetical protein [Burkholderia mayonis]
MGQPNIATETQSGNHSIGARRPPVGERIAHERAAARPAEAALLLPRCIHDNVTSPDAVTLVGTAHAHRATRAFRAAAQFALLNRTGT